MAVTPRSKREKPETITGNSDLSVTPGEPAGAASGDVFVAFALADIDSTTVITRPTGWTNIFNGIAGAVRFDVSYVTRAGSAPNLVWTISGTTKYREVYVLCMQKSGGAITLDSQSAAGATGNATLTAHKPDPPATNAVATTSLAVCGGFHYDGSNTSAWGCSGYTSQTADVIGSDGAMFSKSLSGAGSENPAAFTDGSSASTNDYWDGFTVTFTDAGASVTTAQEIPAFLQALSGQMVGLQWL